MALEQLQRLLGPLQDRLRAIAVRGIVRLVKDTTMLQELQVSLLAGEVVGRAERFQEYGLTSQPRLPDSNGAAEAVVLRIGGAREHPVIVALDDRRFRPTDLQPGEVSLYTHEGTRVNLKAGGKVEVLAATEVKLDAQGGDQVVMHDPTQRAGEGKPLA